MRHAEGSYREAYDLYHQCHDELNDHLPCKSRGERRELKSGRDAELRALKERGIWAHAASGGVGTDPYRSLAIP